MNQTKTIFLLISLLIVGRNSYAQTALYPPSPKIDFSNMGKAQSDSKASYKELKKRLLRRYGKEIRMIGVKIEELQN
ncbi:MAG: hypothetical protein GY816_06970 [Cytophagales bacterium]|nr:hypothetical protein [Cytophagales bacterium]